MVISWQAQGGRRQFTTNGLVLLLVFVGIFFYMHGHNLDLSTRIQDYRKTEPISPSICSTSSPATSPSPYDPKKLAFLIETRPLPHLPAQFTHMVSIIPPEWTFKFMGSPAAISHMRSSPVIHRLESSGKLSIVPIPANYTLTDRETISQIFTDPYLYSHHLSPAEHLLVFQPDSIFCANAPKTLNDFLEYDWIGAPWSKTSTYGGNGGLSLRRVSKILQVLAKEKRKTGDGALEDLWLSTHLNALPGAKMADANASKTFSVESVWDEKPLGYHVGWLGVHHEQIWDDEKQVEHVMEYCPEVKMILGMRLAGDKPGSVQKIDDSPVEETVPQKGNIEAIGEDGGV